jgi:NAD(P)-dependent dehydrogenase (short-subunit alcohol dehydrogenase family)
VAEPLLTLKDRTVVVTGAGSGIGRALALKAASEGMALALCDQSAEGLAETVRLAGVHGAPVASAVLDVRDAGALKAFADATPAPVGLLFANAGLMRRGAVLSQPASEWQLTFDVNVMGVVNTLQAFVPAMVAHGEPARVVITGSQASFVLFPQVGSYCASKHAVLALAESLADELRSANSSVGVSLLAPGAVATAIFGAGVSPNAARALTAEQAAEIAFAGARRGDFLISTHADLGGLMAARYDAFKAALG